MMNYDAMASGSSDPLFLERLDTFMEGTLADIKAFADREFRPLEETLRFVAEWHARNLFKPTRQDDSMQDRTSRVRTVLFDVSRMLETLLEVAGMQSFVLAVDPMNPSDMGFLGGTVSGREFWRNMRNGGDSGAKAFKAHCFRGTESSLPPLPIPPRNSSSRAITPSLRGTPAKSTKADLYDAVRKALRTASGVRNAEMKWTNHERLDGYGVRIVGWPADIPATNPSSLKVSQNKTLLECLENGSLRFEKIVSIPEASPAVEISADDILPPEESASQAVSLNDGEGVQMAEVSMVRVTPETEDSLWTLNPNGDGDVGVSNDTDTENIDKDDNDDDDSLTEQPIATHPTDSEDTYWEASANASLIGDLWADLDIGVLLQTESNPSRKRPRSEFDDDIYEPLP